MTGVKDSLSKLLRFANSRLTCAQRLNCVAGWWFWLTIIGVFYSGLCVVLPDLYDNRLVLLSNHIFIYFMFAQMMTNWLCVRFVSSPYRPEDHLDSLSNIGEDLLAQGLEINLNHLKERPTGPNSFAVPVTSLYTSNGVAPPPPSQRKGPMYLVALMGTGEETNGDGGKRRLVYPYWSWKPCVICQCQRPPRAHHCPLCNMCVLKRDHHCFFTGSCIGLRNQRHFIVFNFWATVATSYCMLHSLVYLFSVFMARNSYWDLVLPFTMIRWSFKWTSGVDTMLVALLYSVGWFWLTTAGFLMEQWKLIRNGSTSFEEDNNIMIRNSQSFEERIQSVFGEHWLLNFICPLHLVYPTPENGVVWPYVKV